MRGHPGRAQLGGEDWEGFYREAATPSIGSRASVEFKSNLLWDDEVLNRCGATPAGLNSAEKTGRDSTERLPRPPLARQRQLNSSQTCSGTTRCLTDAGPPRQGSTRRRRLGGILL